MPQSKRKRKKNWLFAAPKNDLKKVIEKPKIKNVLLKKSTTVESQVYSQSSTNGRNFTRQWNQAIYCGPTENYHRKTKDYSQDIQAHENEFYLLEKGILDANPPKYTIETQDIIEKFSDLSEDLYELYSAKYSKADRKSLQSFIQSELTRISIIYFSNLIGVKVVLSEGHEYLKNNIKENSLLIEKYHESYISDLIDPCKLSLKAYLYNFLHDDHLETYMNDLENKEEEKLEFIQSNSQDNPRGRTSSRLIHKKVENIHNLNRQYLGAFINNEWFQNLVDLDEDAARGNTGEEIIRTWCEELGFKRILINSITMKRTSANLMKSVIEGTQSERINFGKSSNGEKQTKTVLVFEDIDSVFPEEAGFHSGVIKCLENSKVPIILTSHRDYEESEVIKRCSKKGIKIKSVKVSKNDVLAMKTKIRLHIIILFESIIDDYIKDYFKNNINEGQVPNKLELEDLSVWDDAVSMEELESQYLNVSQILKLMKNDIRKILALLNIYTWENILNSIAWFECLPINISNRRDILFNEKLFESSNPNLKLSNEIFERILPDLMKIGSKKEELINSEDDSKAETWSQTPSKHFQENSSLEQYCSFVNNLSDFCSYDYQKIKYQEDIQTQNIFDVNITKMEDYHKYNHGNALDEYFLGSEVNLNKLENKPNIRKCRGQNLDDFEKFLTTNWFNKGAPRMTMGDISEKNDQIPYFCYILKEGCIDHYKRKINSSESLYGSLDEARNFHRLNVKILYNNIQKTKER